MRRVIHDVPRWHVYLHRDARGMEPADAEDEPMLRVEDEIFERLYAGDLVALAERDTDPRLREWARGVHHACEELPAFERLSLECRGEPVAAGIAVEAILPALRPVGPRDGDAPPPPSIRTALARACRGASEAVEELREALDGLAQVGLAAGTAPGSGGDLQSSAIRSLAARLRSDPRLKQIALLAGRMKRIAATKRRERVRHGPDEVADVEVGADLGRLLPSELAKLGRNGTRRLVLRDLLERQALQYQLAGFEPRGRGPLVVLLDKSGSMEGPRDVWATALALALLEHAHSERRTFALLSFDTTVKDEVVVRAGGRLPLDALLTGGGGGTDIAAALARGLEIISSVAGPLARADVVLVTDGGSDAATAGALRERARGLGVEILGLGIGVERAWLEPWCDEIQVVTDLSTVDPQSAERLFAA